MKILKAAYLRCILLPHWRALGCVSTGGLHSNALVYFVRKTESGHGSPRQPVTELALGGLNCVWVCGYSRSCRPMCLSRQQGFFSSIIDNLRVPSRCCMWYWQMRSLWMSLNRLQTEQYILNSFLSFPFLFIDVCSYFCYYYCHFFYSYPKLNNTFSFFYYVFIFLYNICLIFFLLNFILFHSTFRCW